MSLPYASFHDGSRFESPISKVVCVGRNYAEHAKELDNPVPTQPLLFMKPPSSVVRLEDPIVLPTTDEAVHYETELALLIGRTLRGAGETAAMEAIAGVGLALDLTLRENARANLRPKATHGKSPRRLTAHVRFQRSFRLMHSVIRIVSGFR